MHKQLKIVLFNELNVALDTKVEEKFFKLFKELIKDKLEILITHRLSTVVKMVK